MSEEHRPTISITLSPPRFRRSSTRPPAEADLMSVRWAMAARTHLSRGAIVRRQSRGEHPQQRQLRGSSDQASVPLALLRGLAMLTRFVRRGPSAAWWNSPASSG